MNEERRDSKEEDSISSDIARDAVSIDEWSSSNPALELLGENRLVLRWLAIKPKTIGWLPFKILDAILRGFSQVVFANNTFSGLFVLIGLAIADGFACGAGLLAATLATLTALILNHPWAAISNGLMGYNGVLVGTVTASLCPAIVAATHGPEYVSWCLIALGGIMSTLLTSSLANLFKGASIPAMTVPFNLIGILIFVCLPSILKTLATPGAADLIPLESSDLNNATSIDWLLVMRGSLVSMGQIYAVESIAGSVVMYVGILLFSPLLCVSLYAGSLLGSLAGLLFTTNYASVYAGLWGYNPALTSAAVGVIFYVPTALSSLNALAAVLFTVGTQLVMSSVMGPAGLPVLTIPFVVTCAMFLAVTSGQGSEKLIKAPDGRPPECQRRRYNRQRRRNQSPTDNI